MVECQRCGRCCRVLLETGSRSSHWIFDITDEDRERWEREGRDDILEWVSVRTGPTGEGVMADFPVDPEGEKGCPCPFLQEQVTRSVCLIHDTQPTICAEFHCVKRRWPNGAAYQRAVKKGLMAG